MLPPSRARAGRAVLLSLIFLLSLSAAVASWEDLTLDWIFSEERKTAASIPDHAWLETGEAILYDHHPPKAERTLELLNPKNGKRKALVDPAKAIESLTAILEPEEPIEELGWPDAFDPKGRWALYEKSGDLLLLDLKTSEFSVAVGGDAEEEAARFSPDGAKLAFVRDNDLYVLDLESREETRLTTDGSDTLLNGTVTWVYWEEIFGRNDQGYAWSPDSASIAYLQTDESPVALMSFVDFKPNIPEVKHQRYPKAGEANPRVRAGVVDLATAKTIWVDLGVYPYEYLARLKWLPDGERLAVQTLDRPQTTLDLFLADATTGKVSHVLRETDPGWVNLHDDLYFLDDGQRFLWVSERDGYSHLYLYGMDGALIRQVTKGDWALRASGGVFWLRQAVAHIDEEGDWIYFTALKASSVEKQLYRIHMDGTGMERLTRKPGTHRILFQRSGGHYLDAFSSTTEMPRLILREPGTEKETVVAAAKPELLEGFELLPRELLTVPARDGFEMPALMVKPRGFDPAKRYPVILYVYGGPSAPTVSDSWGGNTRAYFEQLLANEGFLTFYVDNRAATAISKTLENEIFLDGYGSVELSDLLDAVRWLKSQSYVDPDRVGIWGWSGGGSYTLLALTSSEEFRAGIAVAAVSDWHYYDSIWAEAFMKRPQDNPEGYEKTSHAERAKDLHGRLLLVHGTYDDNVHPQNAWRFIDELVDAEITFDLMIYPMRKHGIADDEAQKHLYKTMREFWLHNLK